MGQKDKDPETKQAIVSALTSRNPRLQAFEFDFGGIAKIEGTTLLVDLHKQERFETHHKQTLPEGFHAGTSGSIEIANERNALLGIPMSKSLANILLCASRM